MIYVHQFACWKDQARLTRERRLMDELGITGIRYPLKASDYLNGAQWINKGTIDEQLKYAPSVNQSPSVLALVYDNHEQLIGYLLEKGVRLFQVGNEPDAWSRDLLSEAARKAFASKTFGIISTILRLCPEARIVSPALHGDYEGVNATDEVNRHRYRWSFLSDTDPWLKTPWIERSTNLYVRSGSMGTKVRALTGLKFISELNCIGRLPRPGEVKEVLSLCPETVWYCMSQHPQFELMSETGVRNEPRIQALKAALA